MLGWPLEYEAPLVFVVAAIVGFIAMGRWIMAEEAELLRRFGDEYLAYQRETDRLIPSVW
jgi:protein-S-isoprenylcysteine O-methyltransferase Ste14